VGADGKAGMTLLLLSREFLFNLFCKEPP